MSQDYNNDLSSAALSVLKERMEGNFDALATSFAGSAEPTTDLKAGRLFYDADTNVLSIYNGSAFVSPFQASDATLTAIAGLTFSADTYLYATGADTFGVGTITSFARTLLDDADAAALRTSAGLGTISTQDLDGVYIAGGDIEDTSISSCTITDSTFSGTSVCSTNTHTHYISGSDFSFVNVPGVINIVQYYVEGQSTSAVIYKNLSELKVGDIITAIGASSNDEDLESLGVIVKLFRQSSPAGGFTQIGGTLTVTNQITEQELAITAHTVLAGNRYFMTVQFNSSSAALYFFHAYYKTTKRNI